MTIRPYVARAAASILLVLASAASLLAAERTNWLSGPALRKKLQQPESITWSGQALREALAGFGRTHQVAIVIDRRVDPGQPLELSISDTPLAELLIAVAHSHKLDVSFADSVVYLGPPATARRVRTLIELRKEDLAQLPTAARLLWLQQRPWQWQDFATPRELLAELARNGRFEIKNPQAVPHDLWAAADLPALDMIERLTLVLAQFDYTWRFEAGGSAVTIVPMPAEVRIERKYPGGSKAEELVQKLAAAMPGAEVSTANGKIVLRGTMEQHEAMASGVIKPPKVDINSEELLERKTFTLTATNQPVKAILESLKRQLNLELVIDTVTIQKAGRSLDKLVSVKVKDAPLDETLTAVLSPADLKFTRRGKTVEITAAAP